MVKRNHLIHILKPINAERPARSHLDTVFLCGERFVQYLVHERRFAAAGNAGDAHKLSERYLNVDIFEVILTRPSNNKLLAVALTPRFRDGNELLPAEILTRHGFLAGADIINAPGLIERTIDESVHEIVDVFYKPEIGVILENLSPDGSMLDCFEGRKINPGHDLEAMWFLMNIGQRRQDRKLIDKAVEIALSVIEYGWDKEYGGIFYFLDRNGYPTQELEWDQKLWWVHIESAIAMIKGYQLTGNVACLEWFERLHNYMWNHFKDAEYPEWFGYLNRTGEVLLPLKGGKWKGCFHVPRGLYQIYTILSGCKQDCKTEAGL